MKDSSLSPALTLKTLRTDLAHDYLSHFVKQAWAVIEPDTPLVWGWHLDAICDHLEAVSRFDIRQLCILVPPRHTKSLCVSVCWPVWAWIQKPQQRFMFASYSQSLSVEHAVLSRRIIESPWFQERWGHVFQMTTDQNIKSHYENTERGYRISTSVGGTTVGHGADFLVLDDPHNLEEIGSEVSRKRVREFYKRVWHRRVNNPKRSARLCIMQRGHEDDIVGLLKEMGYEQLMLPSEYDPKRAASTSIGFTDPRTEKGELLCPERFDRENIEDEKALSVRVYNTQHQQNPTPDEGVMFKRAWFEFVDAAPAEGMERKVRFWDLAATEEEAGKDPDWTVGTLVGRHKSGIYYVMDVVRIRESPSNVDQTIYNTAVMDGQRVRIREEQEPGASGKSVIAAHTRMLAGFMFKGLPSTGEKTLRWRTFASFCEAKNVKVVRGEWNKAWLSEICAVPDSKHDDQADSVAGAFNELALGKRKAKVVRTK